MENFNWFSSFNFVADQVYQPLTVYVLDIKFWRLSYLQLSDILLFTRVRFSLINTSLVGPNVDLSIDFSFFLLKSACLAKFLLEKNELFWLFPIL